MPFDGAKEIDARHCCNFQVVNQTFQFHGFSCFEDLEVRCGWPLNLDCVSSNLRIKNAVEIEPQSSAKQRPAVSLNLAISSCPQEEVHSYYRFLYPPRNIATELVHTPIELQLPSEERAIALCDIPLSRLAWMFSIVSREYLIDQLILFVYKPNRMHLRGYSPRDLALLLTALAIGALVDLSLSPHDEEAQRYIRLAWSAARSVPDRPSIATVKCLHLMSIYHGLTGDGSDFKDSHRLLNSAWHFLHHVRSILQCFTVIRANIVLIDQLPWVTFL